MEKNETVITECFKCGKQYKNHFSASPCCKSIIIKIDESGKRTNITFLSTFSLTNFISEKKENIISAG
ncbi:hypothetical protein [Chryseobacterium profundimaris]|uniref:Uncharacterized protein n=1 Tax=Chryseobacterium profundimaris TaxID=1387275 RepID=A0ABY1P5F4_9FLAO|nr:hypothetical protein [Chryseobacterium profundimaris]SMP25402.1 hypothetical protein SAMN06264346_108163 [Chryseobacterium profundimaris]